MKDTLIQQLIRDGDLVLYHDYRSGSFHDWSEQGNDAAVTSNVWYGGGGIQFADANGYIQVTDAAELQLTEGSMMVVGDFANLERPAAEQGRLVAKRDVGGTNYDWRIDDTPRFLLYDGAVSRILNADYRGSKSVGVDFDGGGIPNGYLNGVFAGAYTGAVTITADDAPVFIGNFYGVTRSALNPFWAVLIVNRILTATEWAQLHQELLK